MLDVKTSDGIDIYILPDCAKCLASDEHTCPLYLDDCPLGNEVCYPGECDEYTEDWNEE